MINPTASVQIAIINESTAITDADVQAMLLALQTQWNRDLAPVWNLEQAFFSFVPKGAAPTAGSWWVVFLDNSDQADALAYHDLTNEGLPISKVFVKTLIADGASVSVGASHEVCEMAIDPTINLGAQDSSGIWWAYEVCDPCEADNYGYKIGDILVTDFITPAWFGFYGAGARPVDFTRNAASAFQVLSGGYAQKFVGGTWQQVNGALVKSLGRQHVITAAKGSRRERRTRGHGTFRASSHKFN